MCGRKNSSFLMHACGFTCPILSTEQVPPRGYVTFNSSDENPLEEGGLCYRDVTSPINERDVESSSSSSRGTHTPPPPVQLGRGPVMGPSGRGEGEG